MNYDVIRVELPSRTGFLDYKGQLIPLPALKRRGRLVELEDERRRNAIILARLERGLKRETGYAPTVPRAMPRGTRAAVIARDGPLCRLCGALDYPQIDHVYPWSKGGTHELENLRVLCRACNISKGAKVPRGVSNPALRGDLGLTSAHMRQEGLDAIHQ